MVRKSADKCVKLVNGYSCHKLQAESAETSWTYVINCSDDVFSGGLKNAKFGSFWMDMIIHRNDMLAVTIDCIDVGYNC